LVPTLVPNSAAATNPSLPSQRLCHISKRNVNDEWLTKSDSPRQVVTMLTSKI
jgi:hypothetical protein